MLIEASLPEASLYSWWQLEEAIPGVQGPVHPRDAAPIHSATHTRSSPRPAPRSSAIRIRDQTVLGAGDEPRLSDWMRDNLRVCWVPQTRPWEVEPAVIAETRRAVFKERSFALGIAALALVLVGLLATAASAAPLVRQFDGQFRDAPCGSALKLCGSGRISHFGSVTSTVVLRPTAVGPFPGCQTDTGTRTVTFAKEKGKLRLAIRGSACSAPVSRARAWGTFTIVAGSGVFSNAMHGARGDLGHPAAASLLRPAHAREIGVTTASPGSAGSRTLLERRVGDR